MKKYKTMKKKLKLLMSSLLILPLTALAADLVLEWDPNPASDRVEEYRVYKQRGTNWVFLGSSVTTNYTITNITIGGANTYSVTAKNFWQESERSEPVSTPPLPGVPKNTKLRLYILVDVE